MKNKFSYKIILYTLPFLIIFSPKLPFAITHLKVDEILLFAFLPISILNLKSSQKTKAIAKFYYGGFFILLSLYIFGLLWGENPERFNYNNIKDIIAPAMIAFYVINCRYWLRNCKINEKYLLLCISASIAISSLIGLYGLYNPALATNITKIYSPGTLELENQYRFDMSVRAMSVYNGYDVASIMYALALIISIYVYYRYNNNHIVKLYIFASSFIFLAGIVSSARTGLLLLSIIGVAILINTRNIKGLITLSLLLLIVVQSAPILIPNLETLERFKEITHTFDTFLGSGNKGPESFNELLEVHIRNINYPKGLDAIFGFGDNGKYISDSGYVNIFVKYGFLGMFVICAFFVKFYKRGNSIYKQIELITSDISINRLIPIISIFFAIAAIKGGIYITAEKVGPIYALILALSFFEFENTHFIKTTSSPSRHLQ